MKLDQYISDLLYRYQCVTIPGFGAFVAEIVPAQINGSAANFLPPRKVITFNTNIKNNDGLLANHISANENLSFEMATTKIQEEVSLWVNQLENRNSISFEKIGAISVNGEEKNWVFEPVQTTNFLTSSFGLTTIISPEIKREVYKKEVEALEEKTPLVITPERKKEYSFLKYAAVFALFTTVGLFGYKTYNDQQVAEQTLVAQKNVQAKVQEQIQQATFFIKTPEIPVELPVTKEKLPFHLIAGAFRSEENAQKALQMLVDQGFKAEILEKNKYDLYPVAYGSFATLEEAEMEKQKLKSEVDAEAWLLID